MKVYGNPYENHDKAVRSGMSVVDETSYNKFNVKPVSVLKSQIKKAKPYKKFYKFRKKGNTYQEKRYYRFDSPKEKYFVTRY